MPRLGADIGTVAGGIRGIPCTHAQSHSDVSRVALLGAVGVALVAALLLAPGLSLGPSLDASVFSTVGWRITEGDALYSDIWDHKPPGVYLPYIAARLIAPDPRVAWVIVWLVSVSAVVIAAVAIRRILGSVATGGASAWAAAGLTALTASAYLLSLGGGMGETFALAPAALAMLAAVRGRWMTSGGSAGVAVIISLQAAPAIPALVALGILRGGSGWLRRLLQAAAGGGLVLVLSVGWLAWNGGLGSALDAIVTYGSAYRSVSTHRGDASAWGLVPWTLLVFLPLLLGIGFAVLGRGRVADRALALACLTWLVVGIGLIAFQGRFYAHYATPLVLPLALLAGLGLDAALKPGARGLPAPMLAAPMAVSVALALIAGAAGAADEEAMVRSSAERVSSVAERVRSGSADRLLVWGNNARLYELTELAPASRYPYLYPLLTPGYASAQLIADVVREIQADPPRFIVDAGSLEPGAPGLPPLLMPRPVATDGRDLDLLDPLRDFVRANYELLDVIEGWPLYQHVNPQ